MKARTISPWHEIQKRIAAEAGRLDIHHTRQCVNLDHTVMKELRARDVNTGLWRVCECPCHDRKVSP